MLKWSRASVVFAMVLGSWLVAPPASAKTVSPTAWAPKFCRALSAWQTALNNDSVGATDVLAGRVSDLALAKSQMVTFLGATVSHTDQAVKDLEKAGTPRSANGKKIVGGFVKGLKLAGLTFAGAGTTAQNLPTDDLAGFTSGMRVITAKLDTASSSLTTSLTNLSKLDTGRKLTRALAKDTACAFLSG